MIIEKNDAISHGREGVTAVYYQLPNTHDGITVARAVFTGEHGETESLSASSRRCKVFN